MKKQFKAPIHRFLTALMMTLVFFLCSIPGYSQNAEMADTMRSEGKIYVVISIVLLILAGLFGYLVVIDRKAARLERKLDQNEAR
jgi:heme A synthase